MPDFKNEYGAVKAWSAAHVALAAAIAFAVGLFAGAALL